MRVLLTGGSGFIGTNLVEDLARDGVCVLNVDVRPPFNPSRGDIWKKADILDNAALTDVFRSFRPTHVVHLAARTDLDEKRSIEGYAVNFRGTENVLKAAAITPCVARVVVTSTMLICRLGYRPESDEDYAPATLYGESKVRAERITRSAGLHCTWTIVRPTTIWGPWNERLRDEFFAVLRKGYYFHPGNRRCMRSYGYVGNTVHQIRRILTAPETMVDGKTFYLGDPPIDLRDWVGEFSKRLRGKDVLVLPVWLMRLAALVGDMAARVGMSGVPLTTFRLRNMTRDNVVDIGPTLEVTGRGPYSVAEGIDTTARWLERSTACETDSAGKVWRSGT